MIAHKIRIYPNKAFRELFSEQFEYARRDYNRQLDMLVKGIKSQQITPYNLDASLKKIWSYCLKHADFFHKDSYHFPDIIRWNSKRLSMLAPKLLNGGVEPHFKALGVGKQAFKMCAAPLDEHRYLVTQGKRLIIKGFGSITLAEETRFHSFPISIEFVLHNNRYYACFLFKENHPVYLETGRRVGLDVGISTFVVASEENGPTRRFDLKMGKRDAIAKKINKYTSLLSCKVNEHKTSHPSSKRYAKTLKRLRDAYHRHSNLKKNFIEQTCHVIARDYDFIGVENLSMTRMLQKRSVARWYIHKPYAAFLSRLIVKAREAGKHVQEVARNFPSSQLCHECGKKSSITKNLSIRAWTCPHCGAHLDRDENAAKNILRQTLLDAHLT